MVITNNLNVATELYRNRSIDVIITGGSVRPTDGGIVGATTVDLIRQFRVDTAVIGISAIDEDGTLLDFDIREVHVSRAIIENARQGDPGDRQQQVLPLGPGPAGDAGRYRRSGDRPSAIPGNRRSCAEPMKLRSWRLAARRRAMC